MSADRSRAGPVWLPFLELGCAAAAAGLWFVWPQIGAWPLLLALVPWGLRLLWTGRLGSRTAFDVPLLVFVLTAGVAVWAAYDRQAAWAKFWLIVGGILLYYALAHAESIGTVRIWLLAAFGAAVSLHFLVANDWDAYPGKIAALTRLGRALQAPLPVLPGDRFHPNIVGGILAMLLPFAGLLVLQSAQAVLGADRNRTWARWLALGAALGLLFVMLFGLVMATTRGAWLALGGALLLAGLWLVAGWVSAGLKLRRGWTFVGLVGTGLVAVLAVMLAWPGGPIAALEAIPGGDTAFSRAELLRDVPTLVRDYPFIGSGLGGFQMLYSTYVLLIHVGYITHSHNLYLDVAVEQGLLALLALVWMWLLFAVAVWRGILDDGAGTEARRSSGAEALGAAALCLAVMLLHGLVDDVLYGSRAVLLLFVPLAFAVPYLRRRKGGDHTWARLALPLGLIVVLLLALVWRNPLLSRLYSNLGAVRQSRAELSIYKWPEWPLQDDVRRRVNLSLPVADMERALAFDPRNPTANRRLGMIELALGQYEKAMGHLAAAYAAEPGSNTTRQLLGEALIVNGRLDEGRALWAGVENWRNQLGIRAFWYQYIGDKQRAEWVQQAASGR